MCHLPGLGQVAHFPQGEPVVVLGPNVVRPPSSPTTMWPIQSLTGWLFCTWLVGWPITAGWLADWLSHKMSTWPSPQKRDLVAKCVTTLVRLTCGQMYPHPLGRDILWPSVILHLWVRLPFSQMYPRQTSCGQVWYYFTFGLGWPTVRCTPTARVILWPSVILLQVRLTCLFAGKSGASSHSNSSSISIY